MRTAYLLLACSLCITLHAQNQPLIDSLRTLLPHQPDSTKTLTYAQLCWEMAKTDPHQAQHYGLDGLALARRIGFARGNAENLHYIGVSFGRQANYAQALHYTLEALSIAEKIKDKNQLASILRSVGALFNTQQEYARSIPLLNRALHLMNELKNQFETTGILFLLGEAHIRLKHYPAGMSLMKQSMALAQAQQQPYDYGLALGGYAWGLQQQGRFKESVSYDLRCVEIMKAQNYTYGLANALNRLCASHYRLGKLSQAQAYGVQALQKAHQVGNWNEISSIEKNLFRVYTATNSPAQADAHFLAFEAAQDTVFGQQRSQAIAEVQTRYQTQLKDQQISTLTQESRLQSQLRNLALVGAGLLLIVLILLYNRYQLGIKEKRAVEQQRQAEQELSQSQQEKLQLEVDLKHRELASHALLAYQKNEMLGELKQKVDELLSEPEKTQKQKITSIQKFIQSNLHFEEDWDGFKVPFEQVHPRFFDKLQSRFPDLTPNEQKLCAYTRISLSNKEIARLLNINTSSVEMSRYRLKKKMSLEASINLTDFIQRF